MDNETSLLDGVLPVWGTSDLWYDIVFHDKGGNEILRLDEEGIIYKGQRIEDGGEAQRAFVEACQRSGL